MKSAWDIAFKNTEARVKGLPWLSLLYLLLPYALYHVNLSSNVSSGFRKILNVNSSIPELLFGIFEGRDRQRSAGSSHLSLQSYWAESAAFTSPTEKLARDAETQTPAVVCDQ